MSYFDLSRLVETGTLRKEHLEDRNIIFFVDNHTILHRAMMYCQLATCQLLVDTLSERSQLQLNDLFDAILCKRPEVVTMILLKRPDLLAETDSKGYNALHYAAKLGNETLCELFISRLFWTTTSRGDTALHLAISNGNTKAVKLFRGLRWIKNNYGKSALCYMHESIPGENGRRQRKKLFRLLIDTYKTNPQIFGQRSILIVLLHIQKTKLFQDTLPLSFLTI